MKLSKDFCKGKKKYRLTVYLDTQINSEVPNWDFCVCEKTENIYVDLVDRFGSTYRQITREKRLEAFSLCYYKVVSKDDVLALMIELYEKVRPII